MRWFKTKPVLQRGDLVIDISKHNGTIDFHKVKAAGVKAVIIKASEGATVRDSMLFKNASAAAAAGLPLSFYHFATWNNEDEIQDATDEARFFLSVVEGTGVRPSLPLVLDIESNKPIPYTKAEMVAYVGAFVSEIESAEYECAIYASPGFLNSYLPANHPFTHLKLWIADYTGSINPVPGWQSFWMRQYTDKGKIDGINTAVDLNSVQ
jgi:lysozyme